MDFDIQSNRRTLLQHRMDMREAQQAPTKKEREALEQKHGILTVANPNQQLDLDECRQIPPEPAHQQIKGEAYRLLLSLDDCLSGDAMSDLDTRLMSIDVFGDWPRPQPLARLKQYTITEIKHVTLVLPFLLRGWLTPKMFKQKAWNTCQGNFLLAYPPGVEHPANSPKVSSLCRRSWLGSHPFCRSRTLLTCISSAPSCWPPV